MNRSFSPPGRAVRLIGFTLLLLTVLSTSAFAQFQTGNIYGTVTDSSGAALPGVTVSLSGVGAPQVFTTGNDGRFRFLSLSPGRYSVRAELAGLGNAGRDNVQVNVGANTTVDMSLAPTVEQTITVTAETPLLDPRRTGTGATVTRVELESVPSARDPWVVLQQVPGVLVDRINIGGSESGQQSSYVGKGTDGSQATWNVDGVNITDMAATGSSPTYYDFDAFEEMQATTGGTDPRIQTPGVQLNMVTKRGTNEFNGSARWFMTDNDWQAEATVPDEASTYLARANEIDSIEDRGIELGGPIVRDRVWGWASYGENQIDLITAQGLSGGSVTGGAFDKTTLENINAKLNAQIVSNNSATALFTRGDKIKQGRNVGPTRPPETGWNQSGPTELLKIEDTHIFGPSFYLTGMYSKVEGGFQLTPVAGREVNNVYLDPDGVWHNSFVHYESERPQEQYRGDASSFFDTGSINHELKFGFGYRETPVRSLSAWPGSGNWGYEFEDGFGLAFLTRSSSANYSTDYLDVYVGDTMLLGNLTLQVGARFDKQAGRNEPGAVAANPLVPELLPAATFAGDTEDLEWSTISPRIGATYTFGDTRRTLVRGSYNRYVDQLGSGDIALGHPFYAIQALYYYWEDSDGDKAVDRSEILFDDGLYGFYGLDPDNAGSPVSTARIDYDLDPTTTDEVIFGVEHELLPEFTIGANFTHRLRDNFAWNVFEKTQGQGDYYTSADYVLAGTESGTAPNGEAYSVPYYKLRDGIDPGVFRVTTNRPDYQQTYNGLEFNATKRLSNRWMMRGNVSLNDWKQKVGERGFVDPTATLSGFGCSNCDDDIVVQGSGTGSGAKGSIYINSRWSYNLTGLYELPWQISIGASLQGREGYPLPYYLRVNARDGAGTKNVLAAGVDPVRMDDIMNLDLRLGKNFSLPAGIGVNLSIDAFNVTDERTILQRQHRVTTAIGRPNAAANRILELQSPRVFRVGARLTF